MSTCRLQKEGIEYLIAEPDKKDTDIQTIICLHGIGGDDSSFNPQLQSLASTHRVIAWNMPGYKNSDTVHPYTFKNLSQKLSDFVKALNFGKVHLIGQSIGGMLAQEFAITYPSQIKSLVLIATTSAFGGKNDEFKTAFLAARLKPLDDGMSMLLQAKQAIPSIVGTKINSAQLAEAIAAMAAIDPVVYREVLSCLVTFDRRNQFASITNPVCLISGSEDHNAPARTMEKMAQQLVDVQYHDINGAGHLVNLEQPELVNEIITQFLDKRSA